MKASNLLILVLLTICFVFPLNYISLTAASADDRGVFDSQVNIVKDQWDPNDDTLAGAIPLPSISRTPQTHGPHTLGAVYTNGTKDTYDWVKVLLEGSNPPTKCYKFDTIGSTSGPSTYAGIWDSSGNLIWEPYPGDKPGDYGMGNCFRISFAPLYTGWYYLRIRTYVNAGQEKTYSLNYKELTWGDNLGSFNGVTVYSNGETTCGSFRYIPTGMMWQCVEYVNRYYLLKYAKDLGSGNARTYWTNRDAKGLIGYPNGLSTTPPAVGDIIVFDDPSGQYGHVAIVRSVDLAPGSMSIRICQQNCFNDARDVD